MKLRIILVSTLLLGFGVCANAQTPAPLGDVFVGTCDGSPTNTQKNETDIYTPQGQFVAAFDGPRQNSCLTGMTFDATGKVHIISALFGTTKRCQEARAGSP